MSKRGGLVPLTDKEWQQSLASRKTWPRVNLDPNQ